MENFTTLADWLAHCERLHPTTIDMGLERVRAVAERMGLKFDCPIITVAGTNGKGSTCAMLEAILSQAGYRTGVYSSPHLVHFEERCRVRGGPQSGQSRLFPAKIPPAESLLAGFPARFVQLHAALQSQSKPQARQAPHHPKRQSWRRHRPWWGRSARR